MNARKGGGGSQWFFLPMMLLLIAFIYYYSSRDTMEKYEERARELYANDSINALNDSLDVTNP